MNRKTQDLSSCDWRISRSIMSQGPSTWQHVSEFPSFFKAELHCVALAGVAQWLSAGL